MCGRYTLACPDEETLIRGLPFDAFSETRIQFRPHPWPAVRRIQRDADPVPAAIQHRARSAESCGLSAEWQACSCRRPLGHDALRGRARDQRPLRDGGANRVVSGRVCRRPMPRASRRLPRVAKGRPRQPALPVSTNRRNTLRHGWPLARRPLHRPHPRFTRRGGGNP